MEESNQDLNNKDLAENLKQNDPVMKKNEIGEIDNLDKIKIKSIEKEEKKEKSIVEVETTKELNKKYETPEEALRTKSGTSSKLLWGLFTIGILLFIAFYAVLLWGLLSGDISNPIFAQLNIKDDGLRSLLLTLTNFVFGSFALVFLISFLVSIFKWFLLGKNAYNRKSYLHKFAVYFTLFLLLLGFGCFFIC